MADLVIHPVNEVDAALATQFPLWDAHPLAGDFAHRLYSQVASNHQDLSFLVQDGDSVQLMARATVLKDEISFFGLPARLAPRQGLDAKHTKAALNKALDHLGALADAHGAERIVLGGAVDQEADLLGSLCIDRQAKGEITAWIVADLAQDEAMLKRDIRDSYRSLINWGERNITLTVVNAAQPDRAQFDLFPAFHAQISGRDRGSDYWEVYWQEIVRGKAELLLGRLADGGLVSGSIIVGAGDTAYYASGVYARDQFDKPLGHWPLWQAMMRAKQQGYRWFDAGEIADYSRATPKDFNISFFKRGFTSRRILRMNWIIPRKR